MLLLWPWPWPWENSLPWPWPWPLLCLLCFLWAFLLHLYHQDTGFPDSPFHHPLDYPYHHRSPSFLLRLTFIVLLSFLLLLSLTSIFLRSFIILLNFIVLLMSLLFSCFSFKLCLFQFFLACLLSEGHSHPPCLSHFSKTHTDLNSYKLLLCQRKKKYSIQLSIEIKKQDWVNLQMAPKAFILAALVASKSLAIILMPFPHYTTQLSNFQNSQKCANEATLIEPSKSVNSMKQLSNSQKCANEATLIEPSKSVNSMKQLSKLSKMCKWSNSDWTVKICKFHEATLKTLKTLRIRKFHKETLKIYIVKAGGMLPIFLGA